jgi:hypothetical protein
MGNTAALEQKQQWMRERCSPAPVQATTATERHYAVAEVAVMWSLSDDAVRKIFGNEPGVLVIGGMASGARRYRTLRIPASVLGRVHKRLSNV